MEILKNILIVDDEPDILEILSYNLSREHYNVFHACDGKQCITLAKKFLPDLIVMDVRMPEMTGIEACAFLKSDETLKNIPVLFLTADTDKNTAIKAMNAGGSQYVNKPIRISILTAIIKDMLSEKTNSVKDEE